MLSLAYLNVQLDPPQTSKLHQLMVKWGDVVQISLRAARKQTVQCAYLTDRMGKLFEEQRVDFTNMLATITNKQS